MTNNEEPLNTQENIDIVVQENTETKDKIDNSDVSMLLDQIKVLKQEIQNNKPQPKVKKQGMSFQSSISRVGSRKQITLSMAIQTI